MRREGLGHARRACGPRCGPECRACVGRDRWAGLGEGVAGLRLLAIDLGGVGAGGAWRDGAWELRCDVFA